MVNMRLTLFLETNNIPWSEQEGFRPQRTTNQQVAAFSQHIKDALDARNTLILIGGAVTSCTLFNVFIDLIIDIAELVQTVTGVECLLYADDLVLGFNKGYKKKANHNVFRSSSGMRGESQCLQILQWNAANNIVFRSSSGMLEGCHRTKRSKSRKSYTNVFRSSSGMLEECNGQKDPNTENPTNLGQEDPSPNNPTNL
ncbi:unnamed protein product [Rodentolepis nana]|uniref:Reverse transcriptase domain-containing protein n=1 Tax=Rodentolepis nana TaxID=102285 RepID=A0A0R3TH38_RODNA|nr:unnamed protein product [Rodentolepis nana]